jgi:proline iminopeptidase
MRQAIGLLTVLFAFAACAPSAHGPAEPASALYPLIEPTASGYLKVSDVHEIYWEECGNPNGIPVLVLHGGPGGRAHPEMRQYFDPDRYRIILHDQRGGGRSRPLAEWRDNTTWDLVEDINRLREHLMVRGKAVVWGGSWGSTLALAYAEAYPELVSALILRGVFLGTKAEIDYFYHGGAALLFPDNYERLRTIIPDPSSLDYPRQLFEMTQSDDPELRQKAIKTWAYYEIRMSSVGMTDEICQSIVDGYDMSAFSVLESYYMSQGCFLEEGQLLRDIGTIAHIPTFIVNGRFDAVCTPNNAWELAKHLEHATLTLAPNAGHSSREASITEALIQAGNTVADQLTTPGG